MSKHFLDSSDSEEEQSFLSSHNINNLEKYSEYIINVLKLNDPSEIKESDTFKEKLGLLLHNFADRIFHSNYINKTYKVLKKQALAISQEEYSKYLDNIKNTFISTMDIEGKTQLNTLDQKEYLKLFCSLFNNRLTPPKSITEIIAIDGELKEKLLSSLLATQDLSFLSIFNLTLSRTEEENGADILAFSQIANRNNKNNLKYLKQKEVSHSSITSYNIPNTSLKTFNDSHILRPESGNIQTEVFNFGSYDTIFKRVKSSIGDKQTLFVEHIRNVIHGKKTFDDYSNDKILLTNLSDQLTHLMFITEMQRNVATVFTAPMFLDMVSQLGIIDDKKDPDNFSFPMAIEDAVPFSRWITKQYNLLLTNTHYMDFDQTNIKAGGKLLQQEGNIFIKWTNKILGDRTFIELNLLLDIITETQAVVSKYKKGQLSLTDINNLLNDILKIDKFKKQVDPLIKAINLEKVTENTSSLDYIKILVNTRDTTVLCKQYQNKLAEKLELPQNKKYKESINKIFKFIEDNLVNIEKHLIDLQKLVPIVISDKISESIVNLTKLYGHWYNIKIDFDKLFKLKAEEKEKGEFDFDKHETKIDVFKEAMLKAEMKGKLKTLLKSDINKLKRYFKDEDKKSELKEDFSLLNKKRYLKQLDKEQKWGESEGEKFEFIMKHIKTNSDNKCDQIYNDLGLIGENINLGYDSDYSEWSHI